MSPLPSSAGSSSHSPRRNGPRRANRRSSTVEAPTNLNGVDGEGGKVRSEVLLLGVGNGRRNDNPLIRRFLGVRLLVLNMRGKKQAHHSRRQETRTQFVLRGGEDLLRSLLKPRQLRETHFLAIMGAWQIHKTIDVLVQLQNLCIIYYTNPCCVLSFPKGELQRRHLVVSLFHQDSYNVRTTLSSVLASRAGHRGHSFFETNDSYFLTLLTRCKPKTSPAASWLRRLRTRQSQRRAAYPSFNPEALKRYALNCLQQTTQ